MVVQVNPEAKEPADNDEPSPLAKQSFEPNTPSIITGFYMYDFAASVFTNSILLIPILITDLAQAQAQGSYWHDEYECEYLTAFNCSATPMQTADMCQSSSFCTWDVGANGTFKGDLGQNVCSTREVCVPKTENQCCVEDPASLNVIFFGFETNYASVFAYIVSISVILQVIFFMILGPLADYGNWSMFLFKTSTVVGCVCLVCICFCSNVPWEIPASLFCLGNVAYGVAQVFYNGYLPRITTPDRYDEVGAKAVGIGFVGGQLCLFLMFIPLMGLSDKDYCLSGLAIGIGMTGFWWAGFGYVAISKLPEIEGAPFPEGESLLTFGPKKCFKTITEIRKDYPETGKFLLAYFIFSDGLSTIVDTVLVFATEELCMNFDDTITLLIIVELMSAIGCLAQEQLVVRKVISCQKIIIINLCVIGLLPLMAHEKTGIFTSETMTNFWVAAVIFGICQGGVSGLTRSLYTRFIPKGKENEFYGFYEITDKGTSWVGPLTVAIVISATGNFRTGFFSVFFFMAIGSALLYRVDVDKGAKAVGRA